MDAQLYTFPHKINPNFYKPLFSKKLLSTQKKQTRKKFEWYFYKVYYKNYIKSNQW